MNLGTWSKEEGKKDPRVREKTHKNISRPGAKKKDKK